MPLFKKRVSVESLWKPRLSGMFSGKNEPEWDALKSSFRDPALDSLDPKVFYSHVQAMTIEIVNVAIAKSCSVGANVASDRYVDKFLKGTGHEYIAPLVSLYSRAFGSSARDGVREMAVAFSQDVADSRLRPETVEGLRKALHLLLGQVFDLLRAVELVP